MCLWLKPLNVLTLFEYLLFSFKQFQRSYPFSPVTYKAIGNTWRRHHCRRNKFLPMALGFYCVSFFSLCVSLPFLSSWISKHMYLSPWSHFTVTVPSAYSVVWLNRKAYRIQSYLNSCPSVPHPCFSSLQVGKCILHRPSHSGLGKKV